MLEIVPTAPAFGFLLNALPIIAPTKAPITGTTKLAATPIAAPIPVDRAPIIGAVTSWLANTVPMAPPIAPPIELPIPGSLVIAPTN